MATLSKNKRALITARCGLARCGASRCGFTPKDVVPATGAYVWTQVDGPTVLDPSTTWTQATGVGSTPR
jgi:hypothetical protein